MNARRCCLGTVTDSLQGSTGGTSRTPAFLLPAIFLLAIAVAPGSHVVASEPSCVKAVCKTEKHRCKGASKAQRAASVAECTQLAAAHARRRCRRANLRTFRRDRRACAGSFRGCRRCCRSGLTPDGGECTGESAGSFEQARSSRRRDEAPNVSQGDRAELAAGNTAFALDLYHELGRKPENVFVSPVSVSIALAMTYAGAAGNTAAEMADVLHFTLPSERLHPAFNWLDLELNSRGENAEGSDGQPFRLNVVNATWGQKDYGFLESYLDTIAVNYGAGMGLLDFRRDPEGSRTIINDWVAARTEHRIENLLGNKDVTTDTRLVLTNAVYFNAAWALPFEERRTEKGTFHLADGGEVIVPFMRQTEQFGYARRRNYQAVELPYDGSELSMVVLVPAAGSFEAFERSLDPAKLDRILRSMASRNMRLTFPRYKLEGSYDLVKPLRTLGMKDAFRGGFPGGADFSGIDGTTGVSISGVVQKTFVSVNETGTEAAAATGVGMGITSVPPPPINVKIDRPFLFLIRDLQTKTIVFLGRLLDPSSG